MKFNPEKHGVRARTTFRRGQLYSEKGKDLTRAQLDALGAADEVDILVRDGAVALTEEGKTVFPQAAIDAETAEAEAAKAAAPAETEQKAADPAPGKAAK